MNMVVARCGVARGKRVCWGCVLVVVTLYCCIYRCECVCELVFGFVCDFCGSVGGRFAWYGYMCGLGSGFFCIEAGVSVCW